MSISIITAEKKHVCDIFKLLKELADFKHLNCDLKTNEERLSQMLFEEKSLNAFVAVADGVVVGTALYYTSGVSTFMGKNVLHLDEIYVQKDFRKQGKGREIFSKLRAVAKENKCSKIEWKCQSWNVDAGNFYKIMGSKQEEGWTGFSINHI